MLAQRGEQKFTSRGIGMLNKVQSGDFNAPPKIITSDALTTAFRIRPPRSIQISSHGPSFMRFSGPPIAATATEPARIFSRSPHHSSQASRAAGKRQSTTRTVRRGAMIQVNGQNSVATTPAQV